MQQLMKSAVYGLLLVGMISAAEDIDISGSVIGLTQAPIAGCAVTLSKEGASAVTDNQGNFLLTPASAVASAGVLKSPVVAGNKMHFETAHSSVNLSIRAFDIKGQKMNGTIRLTLSPGKHTVDIGPVLQQSKAERLALLQVRLGAEAWEYKLLSIQGNDSPFSFQLKSNTEAMGKKAGAAADIIDTLNIQCTGYPEKKIGLHGYQAQLGAITVSRPNIIFLFADDQRSDNMGAMGNSVIQTPQLDKLARDGVMFTNAFVVTAVCAMSRANTLSGQYGRRTGINDFEATFSDEDFKDIYPAQLKQHGYYIGFIGKWGVGANFKDKMDRAADVFDYWGGQPYQTNFWHERTCNYVVNNGITNKKENWCDCPADKLGVEAFRPRIGKDSILDPVHLTMDIIPSKTLQFLDTRDKDKPFSLSISFKVPHGPWGDYADSLGALYGNEKMPILPTVDSVEAARMPDFIQASLEGERGRMFAADTSLNGITQNNIRRVYRNITGMDIAIGQIRQALAERGLDSNTIILFTSDHGHLMGEHGLFGKWLMYEESIRIPMVVMDPRWPGTNRGKVNDEMALTIDMAPTMLDYAGIPIPPRTQGKSLRPYLDDPSKKLREDWFYEHTYNHGGKIAASEGVRTRRWKYIRYIDETPVWEELYDLENDPGETINLIADAQYTDILNTLRQKWETYGRDLQ